jgi:hypothetical protein
MDSNGAKKMLRNMNKSIKQLAASRKQLGRLADTSFQGLQKCTCTVISSTLAFHMKSYAIMVGLYVGIVLWCYAFAHGYSDGVYQRPYSTFDVSSTASTQYDGSNANILAVVYVVVNVAESESGSWSDNEMALACSLYSVNTNIARYSNIKMYVWTRSNPREIPYWLSVYPNVTVLQKIPDTAWELNNVAQDKASWVYGEQTDASAYRTSRWRMTFGFDFARILGHRYVLYLDPQTVLTDAFGFDIVRAFDEHGRSFGYRNRILQEDMIVAAGLPELARFWMATRNVPNPIGPLLSQMNPPNIEGLSSEGWNRHVFPASFLVVSVDFWFESAVQDFLSLVLTTNADLTQRWMDRDVFNIIRLLFVPEERVVTFAATSVLDQRLPRGSDYHTVLRCPSPHPQDNTTSTANATHSEAVTVSTIEFMVAWEPGVILMQRGATPTEEVVVFRWRYNVSSYGADTAALNNYTGILTRLTSHPISMEWWEDHNVQRKLERLMAKPILPLDPTMLDAEETLEIFQEQLDVYVDFFGVDSAFVQAGDRLSVYCDLIRRRAQQLLSEQSTQWVLEQRRAE